MTHNDDLWTGLQALYHLAREIFIVPQMFSYPDLTSLFPRHPKWKANSLRGQNCSNLLTLIWWHRSYVRFNFLHVCIYFNSESLHIFFRLPEIPYSLMSTPSVIFEGRRGEVKTNLKTETSVLLVFTPSPFKRSVGTVIKSFSTIIQAIGLYQ